MLWFLNIWLLDKCKVAEVNKGDRGGGFWWMLEVVQAQGF